MPPTGNGLEPAAPAAGGGPALRLTGRAVTWGALVAGYALLVQAVMTAIEIVGRKLFSFSFQGVDEIGGYVLAITASFGFGYAMLMRTHTRVDILLRLLPLRTRGYLHLAAVVVLTAVSLSMLWYAHTALGETLLYSSIANSPLQTPLWLPQSLWLAGFATFIAVALLLTFRATGLTLRGDFSTLDREFGTPTIEEDIALLEGTDVTDR